MRPHATPTAPEQTTALTKGSNRYTPAQVRTSLLALLALGTPKRTCQYLRKEHNLNVTDRTLRTWRDQLHADLYRQLAAEHQRIFVEAAAAEAEDIVRTAAALEHRILARLDTEIQTLPPKELANALRNVSTTKALNIDKVSSPLRGRPMGHTEHTAERAQEILRKWKARGWIVDGTAEPADDPADEPSPK